VEHINICICADDSDLRVKNMNTIKKNLLYSNMEGGVKVNEVANIRRCKSSGLCQCTLDEYFPALQRLCSH